MTISLHKLSYKAQNGDVHSMFQLALRYIQGSKSVHPDPEEAIYWLNKVLDKCPSYYTGDIMSLAYGNLINDSK
jgi:TPR repeat protein